MQRTSQLKELRPDIPSIIEEHAASQQEKFQNQVLRPILKFQNDLLVQLFKHYAHKRKGRFYDLSIPEKRLYIEKVIQKDKSFRNLLVGSIVGHFTVEEYVVFMEAEGDLTRRMMQMCALRLQEQLID